MGSVQHINKAQLPQALFLRMLNTMSAEDLAALPVEQFPDHVPEEWLQKLTEEKRHVLEDRIFESASLRLRHRIALSERYGELVADAVALADEGNGKTLKYRFAPRLEALQLTYAHWQTHADPSSQQQLESGLQQLDAISQDLKTEAQAITHCKQALEGIHCLDAEDRKEIHTASIDLKHQINAIQQAVSEYYTLRLLTQGLDLQRASERATENRDQVQALERQIRALDRKAQNLINVYRLEPEQAEAHSDIQSLRLESEKLRGQLKDIQGFISEDQLTHWLDMVVDATVNAPKSAQQPEPLQQAQMALFQLLVRYCQAQESAAKDVANAPFCQIEPENTIRFMLKSEAFILSYFNSKRSELGDWLGDAATSKQQALSELEGQLIDEVRQALDHE